MSRSGHGSRSAGSDAGLTLIELLIAIAILGIGSTAIFGAMRTSIAVTVLHRDQTEAGRILDNFAEYMKAQPYVACPGATSSYLTNRDTFVSDELGNPAKKVYEPHRVRYELSVTVSAGVFVTPTPADPSVTFADPATPGACATATDDGLQRLTLTVRRTDGSTWESVQILKWKS